MAASSVCVVLLMPFSRLSNMGIQMIMRPHGNQKELKSQYSPQKKNKLVKSYNLPWWYRMKQKWYRTDSAHDEQMRKRYTCPQLTPMMLPSEHSNARFSVSKKSSPHFPSGSVWSRALSPRAYAHLHAGWHLYAAITCCGNNMNHGGNCQNTCKNNDRHPFRTLNMILQYSGVSQALWVWSFISCYTIP